MRISGRNQLPGKVTKIEKDDLVAKVTIEVEKATLTSLITAEAVDDLGLQGGDSVAALIKSTSVMLMK